MKISNSKKQLAKIIHENGGWRDEAESAAQCINGEISFWSNTARKERGEDWYGHYLGKKHDIEFTGVKLTNWHQTILSRDEYFHLYPAPNADFPSGDGVTDDTDALQRLLDRSRRAPTIEQLATDYRNAKDYADRKQQEADAAKADAEAKLKALELAGEALGLLVSPITANQESELAIEVKVGDEVRCIKSNVNPDKYVGRVGTVFRVDDSSPAYLVDLNGEKVWCHYVKFIHRPS